MSDLNLFMAQGGGEHSKRFNEDLKLCDLRSKDIFFGGWGAFGFMASVAATQAELLDSQAAEIEILKKRISDLEGSSLHGFIPAWTARNSENYL